MPVVLGNKIVLLTLLSLTNLAQAETMCSGIKRLFNNGCSCGENGNTDLPHDETITYWMRCTDGDNLITEEASGSSSGVLANGAHSDEVQLFSFEQTVDVPINANTMQISGATSRKLIKVTKKIDISTPKFFESIINGNRWKCDIDMYRKSADDSPELFFSVALDGAKLVEMNTVNNYEQLAFLSQTVIFKHEMST